MLTIRKYTYPKCSGSSKLYFCKHCKKDLSYKTYRRHAKLFLKQEKASITVDLPSLRDDTSSEEGIAIYNFFHSHFAI